MLLKRCSALLLSCLLILTTFPSDSSADNKGEFATKDEVVYANLKPNGQTKDMFVVNSFDVTKPGSLIDFGLYNDVRNLTDLTKIEIKNDKEVHFQAEDNFFYQGTLIEQPLPWNISINYQLDGKNISADELAGASGALDIQIKTRKNKDVNPVFFEYYLLQIGLTFDPLHFDNLLAPEGTEANKGKDKLISFNVMPEKEDTLIVSADVTDFILEPIQINAVPANIGFDDPDTSELADQMQELSDAIREINNGVAELDEGATELSKGATELSKGSNRFLTGLNQLNGSSNELVDGSNQILNVFKDINSELGNIPEIPSDLGGELATIPKDLRGLATELRGLGTVMDQFIELIEQIPEVNINNDDIQSILAILNQANENDEEDEESEPNQIDPALIESIEELAALTQTIEGIKVIQEQIPADAAGSLEETAEGLDEFADGLEGAISNLSVLDELEAFKNGLSQLASEYQKFHDGLVAYTDGVAALAQSYPELNQGTNKLADGTSELASGVSELHKGTNELADETSDLPNQFESEIDKFMEEFDFSDFKPQSFVSDKNIDIGVVQFVLQTEKIEVEEPDDEPEEKEVKKNIWDRFLDLFR